MMVMEYSAANWGARIIAGQRIDANVNLEGTIGIDAFTNQNAHRAGKIIGPHCL